MPIRTGFVKMIVKGNGGRVEVWMHEGPMAYTFDALKASLCERSILVHRAVRLGTQDTSWGEKIVTAELHDVGNPV